jgi:hypothetical protein
MKVTCGRNRRPPLIFRPHHRPGRLPPEYNEFVGRVRASRASRRNRRAALRGELLVPSVLLLALALAACHHVPSADTQPLDRSGMAYDTVKQLEALNVTNAEVSEILKMHEAGFSDENCVRMIRVFRTRGQAFHAGDTVSGLIQARMSDDTILALANLNQLGSTSGELEAMHLAGLSDAVVLEFARHRAENKPVLSGAALAGLKNTGLRGSTLLELTRRGVPDSEANAIISLRRHGASDAQILRRFSGS